MRTFQLDVVDADGDEQTYHFDAKTIRIALRKIPGILSKYGHKGHHTVRLELNECVRQFEAFRDRDGKHG